MSDTGKLVLAVVLRGLFLMAVLLAAALSGRLALAGPDETPGATATPMP